MKWCRISYINSISDMRCVPFFWDEAASLNTYCYCHFHVVQSQNCTHLMDAPSARVGLPCRKPLTKGSAIAVQGGIFEITK